MVALTQQISTSPELDGGSDRRRSRMSVFGSMLRRVGSQRGLKSDDESSNDETQPIGGMRGLLRKAQSLRDVKANSAPTAASISLRIRDDVDDNSELLDNFAKATTAVTETDEQDGLRGFFRRAASLRGTFGEKQREEELKPKPQNVEPVLLMTDGNYGKVVFQNLDESFHEELSSIENVNPGKLAASMSDLSAFEATEDDLNKLHNSFSAIHRSSDLSDNTGDTCPSSEEFDSDIEEEEEEFSCNNSSSSNESKKSEASSVGAAFGRSQRRQSDTPSTTCEITTEEGERTPRRRTISISVLDDDISSPPLFTDDDENDGSQEVNFDEAERETDADNAPMMGCMNGSYRVQADQSQDECYYAYDEKDYPSLLQSDIPLSTIEELEEDHDFIFDRAKLVLYAKNK